jgi:hypothetical protein
MQRPTQRIYTVVVRKPRSGWISKIKEETMDKMKNIMLTKNHTLSAKIKI